MTTKKTIFYLERRQGEISLYHFIVLNLGALYYITNELYNIRGNDSVKINDTRLVDNPTSKPTYPITICIDNIPGPVTSVFDEAFDMIKDKFQFIYSLPPGNEYEIVSIYGEPCVTNTSSDNPTNVFPYLRNLFLSKITPQIHCKKRYFIGRKQSFINNMTALKTPARTIINEREFVKSLEKYNIECIYLEYYSFKEKIEIFNSAELIISPSSSALTCLLWCNTDVKVIEIINKGYHCGLGFHFKLICDTLGLKYNRYSNINEDEYGNFTIDANSEIYEFIENILKN
jgi:hypothetical protein